VRHHQRPELGQFHGRDCTEFPSGVEPPFGTVGAVQTSGLGPTLVTLISIAGLAAALVLTVRWWRDNNRKK